MTHPDAYGILIEPATLKIQRLLPGPIERVWAYLTESELRSRWLASGAMQGQKDTPFEFVWRHDELACPPSKRPEGFPEEHRMQCQMREFDPPHKLAFTWGSGSDVSIELVSQGKQVQLTLIHRRIPDRSSMLNIGAGWHAHLDVLVASVGETPAEPFWDSWQRLKQEYDQRLPKQGTLAG
jgi:uncharacterized protein YndB with AHSA1/START domain